MRRGRFGIAAVLAAVALVAACSAGPAASPRTSAAADGNGGRGSSTRAAASDPSSLNIELKPYVSGLSSPLYLTHAGDGSGRLFVVEQGGRIVIVRDRKIRSTPFLDIADRIVSGGEQGLLGLAFHPRYERNRRFYVNYTDTAGDTVVAEYTRAPGRPYVADPDSEKILLQIDQPFANHNGGALAFGPDGYLYIATGDGGGAGDPMGNGQRLDTLLGKLLRIKVTPSADSYSIPPDNPFVGQPGAREEIWSYGLRNPWRFSFDRAREDLWVGDVGQNEWEEINRSTRADGRGKGVNYGWNVMEGDRCFPLNVECEQAGMELPIAVYSHDDGCSVTGGYVYRGARWPAMRGVYFLGDYCSGTIWGLDATGEAPQEPVVLLESGRSVSSFGENEQGELFLSDLSTGEIFRVVLAR